MKFGDDGTVRFDDRGTLFSDPATTGTYRIDGNLITVTTAEGRPECIGTQLTMRASLPGAGAMRFVMSSVSPADCSPLPLGRQVSEQVLPTRHEDLAGLLFSTEPGWQPLSDKDTLFGVWLAEGGSQVLEMDPGGSYFVADESGEPIDRGRWSLSGSELTLTSSGSSAECSNGDQLVLGAVEHIDPGTTALRGTVEKNACGGAWTPAAWILVPHVGS